MMAVTVTGRRSTTEEEMVVMTLEAAAEAQEITEAEAKEVAENLIAKAEEENLDSIETIDLQKDQVEAEDAVATTSVNRATIILADDFHS